MDKKPVLVIMASGLGSRFGGLKQITPVDSSGHLMIDYSIFDAIKAGFGRVICIINPELEQDFDQVVTRRLCGQIDIRYAYQTLDRLPQGLYVPKGRAKPCGTAHAVLCARDQIDAPFYVINADDFYGRGAFETIATFLFSRPSETAHAMIGYPIENTLTEHGSVARIICDVDQNRMLRSVTELTKLAPCPGGAVNTQDCGETRFVPQGTPVSMNLWGFQRSILDEIEGRFPLWFQEHVPADPLKCEYSLPLIPNLLLHEGSATVRVLPATSKWYGVTYAQDLPKVHSALAQLKVQGVYPEVLWS